MIFKINHGRKFIHLVTHNIGVNLVNIQSGQCGVISGKLLSKWKPNAEDGMEEPWTIDRNWVKFTHYETHLKLFC